MRSKANIVRWLLCVLLLLGPVCTSAAGDVIYVDADATGANDGSSWADAYNFLQDALADARRIEKTVEIHVAEGIYKPDQGVIQTPGDRTATFQLINDVALKGGYGGFSEPDPNARYIDLYKTILSGDLNGNDIEVTDPQDLLDEPSRAENSYHVVTGSGTNATAVLNGFTIIGGNADGESIDGHRGGGMHCKEGSPTITNCTFSGNQGVFGGGMCNAHESSPTLTNCTFIRNSASHGGGMENAVRSSPVLTDCTFSDNHAFSLGGGLKNQGECNPTLTNCKIIGNTAGVVRVSYGSGGGMYDRDGCNPILINCIITGNSAKGDSGGGGGGGICTRNLKIDSSQIFINCSFAGNSAPRGNSLSYDSLGKDFPSTVQLTNCILWDSGNKIWNDDSSPIEITYSDIQGGWSGQGNINANPLFVDADGVDNIFGTEDDDLRLSPGSLCIDAGDNSAVPQSVVTDLGGNPRIVNGTVDMGAYETGVAPTVKIHYVDADAAGNNDGSSWSNAFLCLQDALAAAQDGDEIRVANGIYRPDQQAMMRRDRLQIVSSGDWTATFQLIDNVAIIGGYAGFGEPDPNARDIDRYRSVLSGDLNADDGPGFSNILDNSYHVVTASGAQWTAVLDGFTITGGNADGPFPYNHGGGIYNVEGSPTLIDCILIGNSTIEKGGGMYNSIYSNPALINCTFSGNLADLSGGGMYNDKSDPMLTNCTFNENMGGGSGGGGMYNDGSAPLLADCDFTGNSTTDSGGGMYNSDSDPMLLSCLFCTNLALRSGGGMYNQYTSQPNLANCIFSGNSAGNGGAMENLNTSIPVIINCTLSANFATQAGGGISSIQDSRPILVNCILWDNSDENGTGVYYSQIRGQAVVRYSCVQNSLSGNPWPGEGNINTNPYFADPENGDYHLKSQVGRLDPTSQVWVRDEISSPCIDAGDPSMSIGLERFPNGGRINIGAYGGTMEASLSPGQSLPLLGQASIHSPPDGGHTDDLTVMLTWTPGDNADLHDVYFGTDHDAVANATTKSTGIYRGRQPVEMTTYDPGILELNKTYYWRIDEVIEADPNNPQKGNIWSFTTACFIILDDFEDYDADNNIWFSWHDGLGYGVPGTELYYPANGTGAAVGDETSMADSYMEIVIVHSGRQSLPYYYDNNKPGCINYSEATLTLDYPRDWTEEGIEVLSLWFYGDPANAPEQMYVALANANGPTAVVVYNDNPDPVLICTWTEWTIDLQEFADQGVNMTDVNSIAIGFGDRNNPQPGGSGRMYFDDIRLCRLSP